jgi:hypothetical protein
MTNSRDAMGVASGTRATLDELGLKYNTDKASDRHDYLDIYESVLRDFRDDTFVLLDLGVGVAPAEFASTLMWSEYFPNAQVVGVDIQDYVSPSERIEFLRTDLSGLDALEVLASRRPKVVIEDASHMWAHQIISLVYLLPAVQPGGVYIWEDLHTSSPDCDPAYGEGLQISPVELLGLLAQKVALRGWALPPGTHRLAGALTPVVDALAMRLASVTVLPKSAIFRLR